MNQNQNNLAGGEAIAYEIVQQALNQKNDQNSAANFEATQEVARLRRINEE